jgi:hypothetical protein
MLLECLLTPVGRGICAVLSVNTNIAAEAITAFCVRYAARVTERIETMSISVVSAFGTKVA